MGHFKARVLSLTVITALIATTIISCKRPGDEVEVLKSYQVVSNKGVISNELIVFDKDVSSDGNGSLKIVVPKGPTTIAIFEEDNIDIENARMTYSASIKTEKAKGKVYLEMICVFNGKGEFFSRGINAPLTGTTGWVSREVPFFLQKGENPDKIKLNIVAEAGATIWIDDIKLLKAPL
jgi:hypothetical protein